jgi:glycine C-acetyltransferase
MSYRNFKQVMTQQLEDIRSAGLQKSERVLLSPQGAAIRVAQGEVLNLCANNYLGLANHPEVTRAAADGLREYGNGMASVRFICGTHSVHRTLEQELSTFLGTEDTILYSSCFDANTGLFETLLDERDAIISDALNHASLIDGIRLCKATRHRYAHSNMDELEAALKASSSSRLRLIATDGVFSMDGDIAGLDRIADLADQYDAAVVVDDSHAIGVLGTGGRGTPSHCDVADRIDLITGTLGKTLGGGSGGFTSGRKEIIALLRQRSRPYLFSNSLPPVTVEAARRALTLVKQGDALRAMLHGNAAFLRSQLTGLGYRLVAGTHPIIPILLGDASLAARMAEQLLLEGIYAIAFSYPVVPKGQARIRIQMSAAHTREQLEQAVIAFAKVGRALGVIGGGSGVLSRNKT